MELVIYFFVFFIFITLAFRPWMINVNKDNIKYLKEEIDAMKRNIYYLRRDVSGHVPE